jgi:acetyl esterase
MASEPHPQVQSLLTMMDSQPVPSSDALSVPAARRQMEELFEDMAMESVGTVQDLEIPGPGGPLPVRFTLPEGAGPHPVLVYLHGGGFVLGSLDSHDNICRVITNRAECAVLSVDYRLAPEHPFPAAVEDAYATVEWVQEHGEAISVDPDRIAVGGDSAGGNLAAATTLVSRDRDGPALAHQLLIYPAVTSPVLERFASYEENGEGYFLETETMEWFGDQYVQREADYRNAYFAPLLARDLSGLPPATVLTAGFDPLRDEGQAYAERLDSAGVDVEQRNYEAMIHGFVSMLGLVDRAEDAVDDVAEDLQAAF